WPVVDHGVDLRVHSIQPLQRRGGGLFRRYLFRCDEGGEIGSRKTPEIVHLQLHLTDRLLAASRQQGQQRWLFASPPSLWAPCPPISPVVLAHARTHNHGVALSGTAAAPGGSTTSPCDYGFLLSHGRRRRELRPHGSPGDASSDDGA